MRLAVVTHYFAGHRGGIEIVAEALARVWVADGHAVTWLASAGARPEPDDDGITRRAVPALNITEERLGLPYPLWGPAGARALLEAIGGCDVVVLHDSLYPGNVMAFLTARRLGRPVLVIQHIGLIPYANPVPRLLMALLDRLVARPLLRRADQVAFISPTTRDHFAGLAFRRPPPVVFNGVDTACFRPAGDRVAARRRLGWPAEGRVLLFVGRFVSKKGLPVLRALAQRLPGYLWVLAGWGPIDPGRWDLPNVTVVSGRAGATLVPLYQAADLLVLPSVGEGFPLVIQEAMACGLPVLCGEETRRAAAAAAPLILGAPVDLTRIEATAGHWAEAIGRAFADDADREARRAPAAAFAAAHWSWTAAARTYITLAAGAQD